METESEPIVPVLFRVDSGGVTAVFPTEPGDYSGNMTCYAHVGQHSGCSFGWYLTTRAATPAEYADLKAELESIGYRLKVYRRLTRGHRAALAAEVKRINTAFV